MISKMGHYGIRSAFTFLFDSLVTLYSSRTSCNAGRGRVSMGVSISWGVRHCPSSRKCSTPSPGSTTNHERNNILQFRCSYKNPAWFDEFDVFGLNIDDHLRTNFTKRDHSSNDENLVHKMPFLQVRSHIS